MGLDVSQVLQPPPSVTAADMVGILVNSYFTVSRKVSIFMLGPPGIGKSQAVEEAADAIAIMLSSLVQQLGHIAFSLIVENIANGSCPDNVRRAFNVLAEKSRLRSMAGESASVAEIVVNTIIKMYRRFAILGLVRSPLVFANMYNKRGNAYLSVMDFVIPMLFIDKVVEADHIFPQPVDLARSVCTKIFGGVYEEATNKCTASYEGAQDVVNTVLDAAINSSYANLTGSAITMSNLIDVLKTCNGILAVFAAFAVLSSSGIVYDTVKELVTKKLDRKIVETFDSYYYLFEEPYVSNGVQFMRREVRSPSRSVEALVNRFPNLVPSCDYFAVNRDLTLISMGVRRILVTSGGELKFDYALGDLYVPSEVMMQRSEFRGILNFLMKYSDVLNMGIHIYGLDITKQDISKILVGSKICLFHYLDFRLSQLEVEDIKGVPSDIAARYLAMVLFGKGQTRTYTVNSATQQPEQEKPLSHTVLPYDVLRSLESTRTVWLPPPWIVREGFGILFLDELNLAPYYMQAAAYQIVLDRRISTGHELSSGVFVVAAGNNVAWAPEVARELPYPLRNRFAIFYVHGSNRAMLEWALYYANILPSLLKLYLGYKQLSDAMQPLMSPWSKEVYGENYILVTPRSFEMATYMINLTLYSTASVVSSNPLLFAMPEQKAIIDMVMDVNERNREIKSLIIDMSTRLVSISPAIYAYMLLSMYQRAASVLGTPIGAALTASLLVPGFVAAFSRIAMTLLAYYAPIITQAQSQAEQAARVVEDIVRGISSCLRNVAVQFMPFVVFALALPSGTWAPGITPSEAKSEAKPSEKPSKKELVAISTEIMEKLHNLFATISSELATAEDFETNVAGLVQIMMGLLTNQNADREKILNEAADMLAASLHYAISITTPIANGREYLVALMAFVTADYLCTQLPRLQAGTKETGGAVGQRISVAKQDMDRVMALLQQSNMCITNSLRNPLVSDENVIKFRRLIARSIGHTTTSSYYIGGKMRFHPVMRGIDIVNLIKQSKLQDAYFKLVSTEPDVVMSVYDEVRSSYSQMCASTG